MLRCEGTADNAVDARLSGTEPREWLAIHATSLAERRCCRSAGCVESAMRSRQPPSRPTQAAVRQGARQSGVAAHPTTQRGGTTERGYVSSSMGGAQRGTTPRQQGTTWVAQSAISTPPSLALRSVFARASQRLQLAFPGSHAAHHRLCLFRARPPPSPLPIFSPPRPLRSPVPFGCCRWRRFRLEIAHTLSLSVCRARTFPPVPGCFWRPSRSPSPPPPGPLT